MPIGSGEVTSSIIDYSLFLDAGTKVYHASQVLTSNKISSKPPTLSRIYLAREDDITCVLERDPDFDQGCQSIFGSLINPSLRTAQLNPSSFTYTASSQPSAQPTNQDLSNVHPKHKRQDAIQGSSPRPCGRCPSLRSRQLLALIIS